MDLQNVVDRYAGLLTKIDQGDFPNRANARTGEIYLPGVKSLDEASLVAYVKNAWASDFADDFKPKGANLINVKYPNISRAKCDHVITTDGRDDYEWALEIKNIALVGNNGKRNDFAVGKVLSPFLKDRSLLHDVLRLRQDPIGRKLAVIGITFNYTEESCKKSMELHPAYSDTIKNIDDVRKTNGGWLSVEPLTNFADGIMRVRNLVIGPLCTSRFEAWRHPAGGEGLVFAWEVHAPQRSDKWDSRHPW